MKIKICGLKRLEDIDYVNEYQVDYIGFIFAESKRQVSIEQAKKLKKNLNENIQAVGVFVNNDINFIKEVVDENIIDLIQLHGDEDQSYIDKLKEVTNVPIIKAIKVINNDSLKISYDVDYYLLDGSQAGSGKRFDWSLITKLDKPFFMAGGINIKNVNQAIGYHPYALDISSGVETKGIKSKVKIKNIVRRIRND